MNNNNTPSTAGTVGGLFLYFVLLIVCPLAWITHVVFCIGHHMWFLLFTGALIFPIGVIHGFMIWLS